jgi:hypothetical protein
VPNIDRSDHFFINRKARSKNKMVTSFLILIHTNPSSTLPSPSSTAWQYECDNNSDPIIDSDDTPSGVRTLSAADLVCGTAYLQLNWFALFFQLFVMGFLFISYFNKTSTDYKVALMTYLAMVTTLMFVTTNQTFTAIKNSDNGKESATEATAAGFIISMISNLLIIIVIGGDNEGGHTFVPFNGPGSGGVSSSVQMSGIPSSGLPQ